MEASEENPLAVLTNIGMISQLTPAERLAVQKKLWDTLAQRAVSYTMGGSATVRAETAQELLKGVCYVLRHGIDPNTGPGGLKQQLVGGDFDALFKAGLADIEEKVAHGKTLLQHALMTVPAIENMALHDSLRELGVFFKRYHYHHFAHEIPCMIDYPLAHPADEALGGIDYINEYLRRLLIENDFVGRFDARTVTALLKSISPFYKADLLNIYEAVSSSALAGTLIKGDVRALDIAERDRGTIFALFHAWKGSEAPEKLRAAAAALCVELAIGDDAVLLYLSQSAEGLWPRVEKLKTAEQLRIIFPPLYRENGEPKPTVTYIDGVCMDDEMLRALIDSIADCRNVSEKIALAREKLFSLRDWAEVLNICFWGNECHTLFDALSADALEHLWQFAVYRKTQAPNWRSETGWERLLDEYRRKHM
ncbi:DUF6179 domain-containing protein [Oscillospiraceae bacterium WX1]